jgi:hypothetical protein
MGTELEGAREGRESPSSGDIHKTGYLCLSVVWESLQNCPPTFLLSPDPSRFGPEIAQPFLSPWARNFFEAAAVEAKRRLFIVLVVSEWKNRLRGETDVVDFLGNPLEGGHDSGLKAIIDSGGENCWRR